MKAAEVRARFIQYFARNGHLHLPSSSLVPEDDPTLMFSNAGMVQFKRVFQGEVDRPAPSAVTVQKCLRVSGKHNDLEEVGLTARHHTFFEMLGNFSFGDYFKAEAIHYGWEWVTADLGLEPDRLWATVHHSDDEAHDLWLEASEIPPERVLRLGDKENFWQMGETGPCGPCSEIHYDVRPDSERGGSLEPEAFIAAGEADQFMEIWNLVFMQFDRSETGDQPLPAPSIDTGAGLERIAAILQDQRTNYHTDLFMPLIEEAERLLGREYPREPGRWEEGMPFRVLADHARAVAFLLADGVFPSNEKRGYVLRRILRRAVRHAWLMGRQEPTLDRLVDIVVEMMSDVYPELKARRDHLLSTTRAEEERFLATIDEGMRRFDEIAPRGGSGAIAGDEAFKLYDTYGFPADLTELMARERGYDVDVDGFRNAMERQRARSREARGEVVAVGSAELALTPTSVDRDPAEQAFVGYDSLEVRTPVLEAGRLDGMGAVVLADNPFYAEAGGQVSDAGVVEGDGWRLRVEQVLKDERGVTILAGHVDGQLPEVPEVVRAAVDGNARRETERHHTATHLLHAALRSQLGDHVHQAGSLVAPDHLRFDFSHRGPLTPEERQAVESAVNGAILDNTPVEATHRPYREALDAGAMALFGEKYGDVVRTIHVPGVSLELCGGTHVRTTGQIGLFKIVSETGVAAGVRRVEAITGKPAYEWVLERDRLISGLSDALRVPPAELDRRVHRLLEERDRLAHEAAGRRGETTDVLVDDLLENRSEEIGGSRYLFTAVELPDGADFGEFGDGLRDRLRSGAALLHVATPGDAKQAFLSVVTDDLIGRGLKAGDLVRVASKTTGSGGGGKPHFAQGGVGDGSQVQEAIRLARAWADEKLPPAHGAGGDPATAD